MTKNIIDKIIQDLGDDRPIKRILLKAQILASQLNNKEFAEWINSEQNGYSNPKNLPAYRVLGAIVKADIFRPYDGLYRNYIIPSGIFGSNIVNDCMDHVRVVNSLSEIENICSANNNGHVTVNCPFIAYPEVEKCTGGNVQKVWQEIPVSSLGNIVDVFKSKLLSFILDLDKKLDAGVDFSKIEGQNEIKSIMYNYNISSVVANIGDGTVNAGDISGNNSVLCISDPEQQSQIKELVSSLVREIKSIDNKGLKIALETIEEECNKPSWSKKTLKSALNAIQGIATGIDANQLTPIISRALDMLE